MYGTPGCWAATGISRRLCEVGHGAKCRRADLPRGGTPRDDSWRLDSSRGFMLCARHVDYRLQMMHRAFLLVLNENACIASKQPEPIVESRHCVTRGPRRGPRTWASGFAGPAARVFGEPGKKSTSEQRRREAQASSIRRAAERAHQRAAGGVPCVGDARLAGRAASSYWRVGRGRKEVDRRGEVVAVLCGNPHRHCGYGGIRVLVTRLTGSDTKHGMKSMTWEIIQMQWCAIGEGVPDPSLLDKGMGARSWVSRVRRSSHHAGRGGGWE